MAIYKRGSRGEEVRRIQKALADAGFSAGPPDGIFGVGTERMVMAFQKANGLEADSKVGPATWRALVEGRSVKQPVDSSDLDYRCLSLTATFETGKGAPECFAEVAGDFDGMGISFGVLQWNLGQGTLQPILQEMIDDHDAVMSRCFGDDYPALKQALEGDKESQLAFARSIQEKNRVSEPWKSHLFEMGMSEACRDIEVGKARGLYYAAQDLCREFDLWSERAVALMFDIKVQNGSISKRVKALIQGDIKQLPPELDPETRELRVMRIVANRRAEAANARWVEDVRIRKLCIANGEGTVHGRNYDLAGQYGISLKKVL